MFALLARLSNPDDFGHLALYQSIIGLSVLVGTLRFELALPAVHSTRAAAGLTLAVLAMAVGTGLVVAAIAIGLWLTGAPLPGWISFLWIGVSSICLTNAAVHVAIRFGERLPLHLARWGKGSMMAVGATAGLLTIGGPIGLVGGAVVGQLTIAGIVLWTLRHRLRDAVKQGLGSKIVMAAVRRHRDFSLLGLPQAILHTTGEMLPIFVFAMMGEVATAGLYWFFYRGIMAVAGAGAEAAKQTVFLALRKNIRKMDRVIPEMVRWWRISVLHSIWISVLAGFLAPTIIEKLFGNQWSAPGLLLGFLTAWAVCSVASSVIVVLVPVLQIHRKYLEFEIVAFVTRFASLIIGLLLIEHDRVMIAFAGVSMLLTAAKGIWLLRGASASSRPGALVEQLA